MMNTGTVSSLLNYQPIPVVDVFAGPGGLGEGFSSVTDYKFVDKRRFNIALSIEKDSSAYQTLLLRTFLRQFPFGRIPEEYYAFLEEKLKTTEDLYKLYPEQIKSAYKQAWQAVLVKDKKIEGVPSAQVDERIRSAINGAIHWALIGGPPCQAYSIVGRARNKGVINPNDPRVYLYREYYRILAVHRPSIFVMENVKGLLSSKVEKEHIFTQIINDLENPSIAYEELDGENLQQNGHPGYRLFSLVMPPREDVLFPDRHFRQRDFLIESEKYGIPQKRHRLILLGIRNDLVDGLNVKLLNRHNNPVSVKQVIDGLPPVRSQLSGRHGETKDSDKNWLSAIRESIKIEGIWDGVDEQTLNLINKTVQQLKVPQYNKGGNFLGVKAIPDFNPSQWFSDPKLEGVCNHETRAHIRLDLLRYLFAASYTQIHNRFPLLSNYPKGLLPTHLNINEAVYDGKFSDRFCVQKWNEPSRTITSHISKDGHYYIHPDPTQCRSLTVREAARIQTFPDNYYFCGPRTAQFHQVGNAVPPFLAYQIADTVSDLFRQIQERQQIQDQATGLVNDALQPSILSKKILQL